MTHISSHTSSALRLVVRADDAGSCLSANRAIEQSIDRGLVRNVSIMVPGAAFSDAVQRFAKREDICLGLHITLNSEWKQYKWGPVCSPKSVPSLVDNSGQFTPSPSVLAQRGFNVEESMREIRAQLKCAREAGFDIAYIDEHMGVSWIGIRQNIAELCRSEGLIDTHGLPSLPLGTSLESAKAQISTAVGGDYVWVTHPGCICEDMLKWHTDAQPNDGSIAHQRDAERRLLIDPTFSCWLRRRGVQMCVYKEL